LLAESTYAEERASSAGNLTGQTQQMAGEIKERRPAKQKLLFLTSVRKIDQRMSPGGKEVVETGLPGRFPECDGRSKISTSSGIAADLGKKRREREGKGKKKAV